MNDWYEENIEVGVRDIVRLLRDNGFNTACSCHHDMEVMIESCLDGEMQRLHNLLYGRGYRDYSLQQCLNVENGYILNHWLSVHLLGCAVRKDDDSGGVTCG